MFIWFLEKIQLALLLKSKHYCTHTASLPLLGNIYIQVISHTFNALLEMSQIF